MWVTEESIGKTVSRGNLGKHSVANQLPFEILRISGIPHPRRGEEHEGIGRGSHRSVTSLEIGE